MKLYDNYLLNFKCCPYIANICDGALLCMLLARLMCHYDVLNPVVTLYTARLYNICHGYGINWWHLYPKHTVMLQQINKFPAFTLVTSFWEQQELFWCVFFWHQLLFILCGRGTASAERMIQVLKKWINICNVIMFLDAVYRHYF